MNTKRKGNKIQFCCIKLFEDKGYVVSKCEVGGKWVKDRDMFGLFDIICINHNPMDLCFVQITCNKPHVHKKFIEFSAKYSGLSIRVLQYVWIDRKGFKVYEYTSGKKVVRKLY